MLHRRASRISTILTGVLLAGLLFGCGKAPRSQQVATPEGKSNQVGGTAAPSQPVEKVKMRVVGTLPVGHHLTKALEQFKDIVEKKAGDRVAIQLYPAQQLYNDKDIVNVLPKGGVELAIVNLDFWSGLVPSVGILFMPGIYESSDHFYKVREAVTQEVAKDFEARANSKLLSWVDYGEIMLISKRPVQKLGDFKGMRLRGYGEYSSYFLQSLDAVPAAISSGEVYEALSRGVLDGALSGPSSFASRKWYEVAKYVTDAQLAPTLSFAFVANLDFYNKLSPDLQRVLRDAAKEIEVWSHKAASDEDEQAKVKLKNNKVNFVSMSAEDLARIRERALPVFKEKYAQAVGAERASTILKFLESGGK